MKNTKAFSIVAFLLTVTLMICVASVSVFATGEYVEPETATEIYTEEYVEPTEEIQTEPPVETQEELTEETTAPTQVETQAETVISSEDEYLMYGEETQPPKPTEKLTEPTSMVVPEVEISDISLIGGVIAWLCVAVGIAVIAGVLVSQRTKQVNNTKENRRR